ncbi:hypothetical protein PQR12_18350 [Paraburkholderia nemoris]|uniref:hypothetical protein n=1 Tax=Paraburkholderia nemoris TaxID=2793076 RepID=UPI0038BAEF74
MADNIAVNTRTFSLQTPADLYEKIHFEALALHNDPPSDLTERAYAVMNAVTSAWQMKDWVYESLAAAGRLQELDRVAGRKVTGRRDFGTFLTENSPWMNVCFQLATAAKHFEVSTDTGLEVVTSIEFQFEPGEIPEDVPGRQEIMVATNRNTISGPGLVLLLDFLWEHLLRNLGLLA